ncbi:fimbria/pilus periplasmic chaperone [Brevundimonas sp. 2R-24]|uniref:Fimbria/pilus periplasmic chaperone n=1 Tax=Peiella sedimenti TaxID=3061083 RepID=A0ABT8SNY9_9CAUL|nr:fimbria/pilus periplasmic chaperone [Caulobacteraceae bacterium XZ-24]
MFSPLRSLRALGAALILAGSVAATALQAHEVSPMRVFLQPQNGQTSAVVTVSNSRTTPLPFEIRVLRRDVAPDGSQTFTPAEDQFTVFPPQALVQPQQSQAVRFQYIGDPALAQSASYVLQVKEVPVIPDGFSGIITVYDFGVAVYVQAQGAQADLAVHNARRDGDSITFEVENSGRDYGFLAQRTLTVAAGGQRREIAAEDLAAAIENPIVPPLSTRLFTIPAGELPQGPVTVDLGPAQ